MAKTYKAKVYLTTSSSTKTYTFAFDYINKRYIKGRLNDRELVWGTDYTVLGHSFNLVQPPPSNGTLEIYRQTPSGKAIEWYDGSILRAKDLNLHNIQMLHITEENYDYFQDHFMAKDDHDNKWEARELIIKNVKDPINAGDALNKKYFEAVSTGYLQRMQAGVDESKRQAGESTKQAGISTEQANRSKSEADRAKREADKGVEKVTQVVKEGVNTVNTTVHDAAASINTTAHNAITTINAEKTEAQTTIQQATEKAVSEAKHYADIAGEVAGGDFLTKSEAISTYLPLDGGTITGDLTVNGTINGTSTKALIAVAQYVGNQSTTTWERQKAYTVGDIVYSSKLPPGYYLECTTSGTTDTTEPVIPSDLSFGGWLIDGTCAFAVKNTYSKLNIVTPPVEVTGSEVVNAEWVNSRMQGKTDLHSALHRYGDNPTDLKGLTNEQWHGKGTFISYFSKPDLIENQPSTYGQLINLIPTNDESIKDYNHDVCQIWVQQSTGNIWTRGGNIDIPLKEQKFNECVILKAKWGDTSEGWRLYSDNYFEYWTVKKTPSLVTYPFPIDNWKSNIQATPIDDYDTRVPTFLDRTETSFVLDCIDGEMGYFFINVKGYAK